MRVTIKVEIGQDGYGFGGDVTIDREAMTGGPYDVMELAELFDKAVAQVRAAYGIPPTQEAKITITPPSEEAAKQIHDAITSEQPLRRSGGRVARY